MPSSEYRQCLKTCLYFVLKLFLFVASLYIIFTYVFGISFVQGEAMYPRMRDGDLAVYYKIDKEFEIGDVVVYSYKGTNRYARVVAREGDVIDLSEYGELMINGNIAQEEIFYPTHPTSGKISYPYTVKEDSYFLLCDFRTQSSDSRDLGCLNKEEIVGKVITILRRRGI